MLLLVAATWGGSYLAIKQLGLVSSPAEIMAIRFAPAAVFLWLFWARERTPFRREEVLIGLLFGVSQVIILALEANSVQLTSATNGGLIVSLAIVLTPIFEGLLGRKWLPGSFFVAAGLATAGVGLLVSGNGFVVPNLGDLLMLGAAFLRGLHFAFAGKLTQGKPYSALNLTTLQVTVAAIATVAYNPIDAIQAAISYTLTDWLIVLFLSLFCTSLAFIGMTWGIKHTSASRTSLLLSTEPIWATLIAVSLGGEHIGVIGAVGATVIIGASYWGQAIESRHRLGDSASKLGTSSQLAQ